MEQTTKQESGLTAEQRAEIVAQVKASGLTGEPALNYAHRLTLEALRQKIANTNAEIEAETTKKDADMKAKGYTHRYEMWIHPINGGDDFSKTIYTQGELPQAQLNRILKNSAVKDDYTKVAL